MGGGSVLNGNLLLSVIQENKNTPPRTNGFMQTLGAAKIGITNVLRNVKCTQPGDKILFVCDCGPLVVHQTGAAAPTPTFIYKGRNHDSRRQE